MIGMHLQFVSSGNVHRAVTQKKINAEMAGALALKFRSQCSIGVSADWSLGCDSLTYVAQVKQTVRGGCKNTSERFDGLKNSLGLMNSTVNSLAHSNSGKSTNWSYQLQSQGHEASNKNVSISDAPGKGKDKGFKRK